MKSTSTFEGGAWSLADLWIEIIGEPENVYSDLIYFDTEKDRVLGRKNYLIYNQRPSSVLSKTRIDTNTKF